MTVGEEFDGRVALVTGASRGDGRAIARVLPRRGSSVVLGARDQARLEEAVAEIRAAGGRAEAAALDVADRASVLFGLLITTIGVDAVSGNSRYIFFKSLYEGIPLIPVLVGLFAVSEVFLTMEELAERTAVVQKFSGSLPTLREYLGTHLAMLRGTLIGFVIGIVPGAGKAVASFIAYNEEKRASKHPERFGTGVLEGVASPEAANNGVVGGALVPLLSLGIPGSDAAAVLIGAFTIQGLQPGPLLFAREPGLVYGLFASLLVGNLVMLALVGEPLPHDLQARGHHILETLEGLGMGRQFNLACRALLAMLLLRRPSPGAPRRSGMP